jgi:hypothetical protein
LSKVDLPAPFATTDAVAALDAKIEVPDDRTVPESLGDMVCDDYRFRSDIVVGEAELGDPRPANHRGTGRAHSFSFSSRP